MTIGRIERVTKHGTRVIYDATAPANLNSRREQRHESEKARETPRPKVVDAELVTERFDQILAKEIDWLWPERVPASKLTIYSGNPDGGKTTAAVDATAHATNGSDWPDGAKNTNGPMDVLFASAEDDPSDTLKPRLMAAGANLERVHLLKCVRLEKDAKKAERMFALDTDLDLLEGTLKRHPEIKLVTIDPVTNYLGRANVNREQELRAVLVPIKELAERPASHSSASAISISEAMSAPSIALAEPSP